MNDALVAVGIGNTTITIGVSESWVSPGQLAKPGPDDFLTAGSPWQWSQQVTVETAGFDPAELQLEIPAATAWRVASVHRPCEQRLAAWVRSTQPDVSYRNLSYQDLPLDVCVDHPDRVGMDRLVAAVAVNQLRDPLRPAVIVDAGTAITVDLVNPAGEFRGGSILPGMRLVSRALAANTDQLPRVDPLFQNSLPDPIGISTEGAIRSGLFWGSVGAVRELVARIGAATEGSPQLFFTGGDAEQLAPLIAKDGVFIKDLVLGGILAAQQA